MIHKVDKEQKWEKRIDSGAACLACFTIALMACSAFIGLLHNKIVFLDIALITLYGVTLITGLYTLICIIVYWFNITPNHRRCVIDGCTVVFSGVALAYSVINYITETDTFDGISVIATILSCLAIIQNIYQVRDDIKEGLE